MDAFGIKELYSVSLKTTSNIEINGIQFEEGETIVHFNKIQFASLGENKQRTAATGGFGNRQQILWETTTDIQFQFSCGVVSKVGLAILSNSKIKPIEENTSILVQKMETLPVELGKIRLTYVPITKVFLYDAISGIKIQPVLDNTDPEGRTFIVGLDYVDVIADYSYSYKKGGTSLIIGERLINGYLSLEGKTRLKDDIDGHEKTGIIRIPRLKLMSNLSMRLGTGVTPMMSNFAATGYPVGNRHASYVGTLDILSDDVDADF